MGFIIPTRDRLFDHRVKFLRSRTLSLLVIFPHTDESKKLSMTCGEINNYWLFISESRPPRYLTKTDVELYNFVDISNLRYCIIFELSLFFIFQFGKMSDRKAVIKNADMSEEMQTDAVDCATQALEKYNIEKDIAAYIKKEFDKKYNPTWHCIVGRNFGSYVTHETKHFIYFYLGQVAILLFKSG